MLHTKSGTQQMCALRVMKGKEVCSYHARFLNFKRSAAEYTERTNDIIPLVTKNIKYQYVCSYFKRLLTGTRFLAPGS